LVTRVHLLIGSGLNIAGEGATVGSRQVSRAAVEGISGINAGRLGGLLLLGSLLLLICGSACCGGCISVGEVIDTRLGALLTIDRAGGGQLRRSVDWPSVGHVFRESTAADMAVFMATDIVVAVGGVL